MQSQHQANCPLPEDVSVELTQVGDGVGVDVCWECFLSPELCVGNPTVLQSEALQLPRFTGQLPVHLHGCLVQDLCEEAGRTGNCGTDRDRRISETELNSDLIQIRSKQGSDHMDEFVLWMDALGVERKPTAP